MIGDFEISKSGDLIFKNNDIISNSLRVCFSLSKTKAMKVTFDLTEFESIEPSNNSMKISFNMTRKTANKSASIVKEKSALSQLLTLKLKTTLGELPYRPEFGSKISLLKHKEINEDNLKTLENYIRSCISDIVLNPTVSASAYIDYNNGYNQTVIIKIYDSNKKVLDYILER